MSNAATFLVQEKMDTDVMMQSMLERSSIAEQEACMSAGVSGWLTSHCAAHEALCGRTEPWFTKELFQK